MVMTLITIERCSGKRWYIRITQLQRTIVAEFNVRYDNWIILASALTVMISLSRSLTDSTGAIMSQATHESLLSFVCLFLRFPHRRCVMCWITCKLVYFSPQLDYTSPFVVMRSPRNSLGDHIMSVYKLMFSMLQFVHFGRPCIETKRGYRG